MLISFITPGLSISNSIYRQQKQQSVGCKFILSDHQLIMTDDDRTIVDF